LQATVKLLSKLIPNRRPCPTARALARLTRWLVSFLLIFLPQLVPARGRWFVVCLYVDKSGRKACHALGDR
jgi:hypothetical protein